MHRTRDHPRTRGEKFASPFSCALVSGSPPHTRGKAPVSIRTKLQYRITPAHAGKSIGFSGKCCVLDGSPPHTRGKGQGCDGSWKMRRINFSWDHPRTRGEKSGLGCHEAGAVGSPPHTRGKDILKVFTMRDSGITPAHAGKSK